METELARAVDVVMARAKRIYILVITVFSKRNREHVLRVYRVIETLVGELEKAFLVLPNLCSYNSIETRYMSSIS